MAARKPFFHPDYVRKKIQTSVIIDRLTKHVQSDKPLMDASQVQAARLLLDKVLPNLSTTTLTGDPDAPLRIVTRIELVAPGDDGAA